MTPTDTVLHLSIDGQRCSRFIVDFLVQSGGDPGGHTYEIRVVGKGVAREWFPDLALGTHRRLRGGDAALLFYHLDCVARPPAVKRGEPKYFLNTVKQLTISTDEVVVHGVCSEILRDWHRDRRYG